MKIVNKVLKEIAYELYKIHWEREHISTERKLAEYRLYCLELLEEFGGTYFELDYDMLSFEAWLFEYGYDSEIYACFDEFIECEYQDVEYMKFLLSHNSVFWKAYKKHQGIKE